MTKTHFFVEQDSGWNNGCYESTMRWKPVERQEAELIQEALHLKEVARAQQKLLEPYRKQVKIIDGARSA